MIDLPDTLRFIDAVLLMGVSGAAGSAIAFVVAVCCAEREIAVQRAHAEEADKARVECQTRHWFDNERNAATIRELQDENETLQSMARTHWLEVAS